MDNGLTREQHAALRYVKRIGERLVAEAGEMACLYWSGWTVPALVERYQVATRYPDCPASPGVARTAVRYALRQLLWPDELATIAQEHNRIAGQLKAENRIGVHGFSQEERQEAGRAGGAIGGHRAYAAGAGAFGLTPEERTAVSEHAGRVSRDEQRGIFAPDADRTAYAHAGLRAQGKNPMPPEVWEAFLQMYEDPSYSRPQGRHAHRPDLGRIADELEQRFGVRWKPSTLNNARINRGILAGAQTSA